MSEPKPFVIITVGPTGAGKTGLVKQTITHCGLKSDPYPRVFLVDDLVVNNPNYKEKVLAIIREHKITSETVESLMTQPKIIKAFNDAYFEVRNAADCVKDNPKNCNDFNDSEMMKAIQAKESFVLEITGSSIPKWFLDREWLGGEPDSYDVFVSCVLVSSLDILIERNKSRFKQSFLLFMSDQENNPAPRLPNITQKEFDDSIVNITKTVKDMYNKCVLPGKSEKDESKCGNENIDRLLLFSNNERMELEFDSNFDEVIERLYKSTNGPGESTNGRGDKSTNGHDDKSTNGRAGRRRRTQKRRRFHKRFNTKKMRKSIKSKRIRKHPKIYLHL
jgi:hypothetical protein